MPGDGDAHVVPAVRSGLAGAVGCSDESRDSAEVGGASKKRRLDSPSEDEEGNVPRQVGVSRGVSEEGGSSCGRVAELEAEVRALEKRLGETQRALHVEKEKNAALMHRTVAAAAALRGADPAAVVGAMEADRAAYASSPPSAPSPHAEPLPVDSLLERLTQSVGHPSSIDDVLSLTGLKERALDALHEGITIADFSLPDQPLIYVNQGFERITGYSRSETVGYNCRFLQGKGTDPKVVASLRENISKGRTCSFQLLNYKKNGQPFFNYLSLTPIKAPDGRVTHYVGIQSDVTDIVRGREAEINALKVAAEAEAATEAKSKFLAHMSHEIRTPLNGLIAVGQMLEETPLSAVQQDLVSTIRNSGEALLALITDILDFSRIEADKLVLQPDDFPLSRVMESAIEISGLRAAQKRLNVAYHVARDVPRTVRIDPNRLQQVLLNTLNNAVKFTDKGEVIVRVWRERSGGQGSNAGSDKASDRPSVSSGAGETEAGGTGSDVLLHFSITDTGLGLTEKGLSLLFHSFSQLDSSPTRKYDGTGLGLAISRRLCEAMGGTMWAVSEGPGKGSTFHFTVMVGVCREDAAEEEEEQLAEIPRQPSGGPTKVLLFERCEPVRQLLAEQVRTELSDDVAVDECDSVERVVARLRQHRYDIVVAESSTPLVSALRELRLEAQADCSSRSGLPPAHTAGPLPRIILMVWPPALVEDNEPWFLAHSVSQSAETSTDADVPDTKLLEGLPVAASIAKPVRVTRLVHALRTALQHTASATRPANSASECDHVSGAQDRRAVRAANVAAANRRAEATTGASSRLQPGKIRILLAEDNAINVRVARGILARCGHTDVTVAQDGIEVLEKLHALDKGPEEFDVILMDLHMPRMGGVEAVNEIQRLWPKCKTPIVAVTADAFEESRSRCLENGFTGWLAKPFRVEELEAALYVGSDGK